MPTINKFLFPSRLKSIMRRYKITGQKLGKKVYVSQKTISRYATGQILPSEDMIKKIKNALLDFGVSQKDIDNLTGANISSLNDIEKLSSIDIHSKSNEEIYNENIAIETVTLKNMKILFSMLPNETQKLYLEKLDFFKYLTTEDITFILALETTSKPEIVPFIIEQLRSITFTPEFSKTKHLDKVSALFSNLNNDTLDNNYQISDELLNLYENWNYDLNPVRQINDICYQADISYRDNINYNQNSDEFIKRFENLSYDEKDNIICSFPYFLCVEKKDVELILLFNLNKINNPEKINMISAYINNIAKNTEQN